MQHLGLIHDLERHRPLNPAFYHPHPVQTGPLTVRGPASVQVFSQAREPGFRRYSVCAQLDDYPAACERFASAGARRTWRVWVPPGRHAFAVHAEPGIGLETRVWTVRGPGTRPPSTGHPVDEAEWAYLMGQRSEAETAFRAILTEDREHELARVRLMELTEDPKSSASGPARLLQPPRQAGTSCSRRCWPDPRRSRRTV